MGMAAKYISSCTKFTCAQCRRCELNEIDDLPKGWFSVKSSEKWEVPLCSVYCLIAFAQHQRKFEPE